MIAESAPYGIYRICIDPRSHSTPAPELLESYQNGSDCVYAAHKIAQDFYHQKSQKSVDWSIITLRATWVVYNILSGEIYVFYARWRC